jgi:hypothetical protein
MLRLSNCLVRAEEVQLGDVGVRVVVMILECRVRHDVPIHSTQEDISGRVRRQYQLPIQKLRVNQDYSMYKHENSRIGTEDRPSHTYTNKAYGVAW